MKKIITALVVGTFLCLLTFYPALAVEQGPPVDALGLDPIPFFEFSMNKNTGPKKFELKLPVALETQGLKGPLTVDDPVGAWFWEKYNAYGVQRAMDYDSSHAEYYQTPFMRVMGVQTVGTPVKIKIKCPAPDRISMPLSGLGGKSGNTRYTMVKTRMNVDLLDYQGRLSSDENKATIHFKEDEDGLEVSWVPSMVERNGKMKLSAPVVMELSLMYLVKQEKLYEGKIQDKWTQKAWRERRVAWLALPVCGMEIGEDDEPLICPAAVAQGPQWQEHTLGPVSVQIPDNWESKTKEGSGMFEVEYHVANFGVIREPGAEKMIKSIADAKEQKVSICGLDAVEYKGLARSGKVLARLIIFNDNLSDGKPLCIAASAKNDTWDKLVDTILASVKIGGEKAAAPGVPAAPESTITVSGDIGSGSFVYEAGEGDQTRYEHKTPEPASPREPEVPGVDPPSTPVVPEPAAVADDAPKAELSIKKLRGFSDFTGRNETLQADGSPDTWLKLKIDGAQGLRITGLALRNTDTKVPVWDTDPGNAAWLLAAAKKNKSLNTTETGTLDWTVDTSPTVLDLYLQDNNTIAAGKQTFELVISFDNSTTLVVPMER